MLVYASFLGINMDEIDKHTSLFLNLAAESFAEVSKKDPDADCVVQVLRDLRDRTDQVLDGLRWMTAKSFVA